MECFKLQRATTELIQPRTFEHERLDREFFGYKIQSTAMKQFQRGRIRGAGLKKYHKTQYRQEINRAAWNAS
jgi:hypothetical protein